MTEEKFTELVDLYLDREISTDELALLKVELASSDVRSKDFQDRCRLHQALRLALNPDAARSPGDEQSAFKMQVRVDHSRGAGSMTRWMMGSGVAACFAVGFILFVPESSQSSDLATNSEYEGVGTKQLVEDDPLDRLDNGDIRRFVAAQEQREANRRASLVAQLRLLGLSPEISPREKELRSVSMASIQPKDTQLSHAELLREIQEIQAIPEPQLLRVESYEAPQAARWPAGFQASLASFK